MISPPHTKPINTTTIAFVAILPILDLERPKRSMIHLGKEISF